MTARIAAAVVHYGLTDPRTHTGGVESFARNLELVFDEVLYMTPLTRDVELVKNRRLPVICDNHMVLDWPEDVPVIGFQHGVALKKTFALRSTENLRLALRQRRAARRARTLWVACARWISESFARLHGNRAAHVVYHAVDLTRFDGKLQNSSSRLVLHDGRLPHKGSRLYPKLQTALPEWRFESLSCAPSEVPERMRGARAFLHLSRYEGNSIVCNEAMAMNLPCLFTRVGLMLDGAEQFDVRVVPRRAVYGSRSRLIDAVRSFLDGLDAKSWQPRRWVIEHASRDANRAAWERVLGEFRGAAGWR